MNSLHTDDHDVRAFLRGASDAAAPTLHAPPADVVVGLGTQRLRRRRAAVAGGALGALAAVVIGLGALTGGFTGATDLRPAKTPTSQRPDPSAPGSVEFTVPRNNGADTTYAVSIFQSSASAQVELTSDSWEVGSAFAPGTPIEGATPDVRIVILPSDAVTANLLPTSAAGAGGVVSSAPTLIPGTAWRVMAFRYDTAPKESPTGAMWFRADGTPVTAAGAGTLVQFASSKARLWLHQKSGLAGLSLSGTTASGPMAAQHPVNTYEMSTGADAKTWLIGGYVNDTATNVRATLDNPAQHQLGAVELRPVPGTTWTAFLIRVATDGTGAAATITWTGSDGAQHSGRA